MTDNLSSRNRFSGVLSTGNLATLRTMQQADPSQVAKRVRALGKLLNCSTVEQIGGLINAQRNRVSGWVNGYNLPPIPQAIALIDVAEREADARGLTLDWLYLGNADAVPMKLAIRLAALEEGVQAPAAAPEPVVAPELPVAAKPAHRKASRKPAT